MIKPIENFKINKFNQTNNERLQRNHSAIR